MQPAYRLPKTVLAEEGYQCQADAQLLLQYLIELRAVLLQEHESRTPDGNESGLAFGSQEPEVCVDHVRRLAKLKTKRDDRNLHNPLSDQGSLCKNKTCTLPPYAIPYRS